MGFCSDGLNGLPEAPGALGSRRVDETDWRQYSTGGSAKVGFGVYVFAFWAIDVLPIDGMILLVLSFPPHVWGMETRIHFCEKLNKDTLKSMAGDNN